MRLISGIGSCISGNAVSVFRQSNHFQNRPGSAAALPATTHLFSGNQTISRTVRFVASTVQPKPDQTWQRVISGIGCAVAGNVSATIYPRCSHRLHHFRHGRRQRRRRLTRVISPIDFPSACYRPLPGRALPTAGPDCFACSAPRGGEGGVSCGPRVSPQTTPKQQ